MALSRDQLEDILTNRLKVDDWKLLLNDDKLTFLKVFIKCYLQRNHFQNLTVASVALENRKNPSEEDVIERGLIGKGGVCIDLNHFAKLILDGLGFDTFAVSISWASGILPGTHFGFIVQFSINESYFVDVGCGLPFWEPVPLQKLPFRRVAGGYPFEFRRNAEGLIQRFQLGGSYFTGDYEGVTEMLQYTFSPTPQTFEEFDPVMKFTFASERSFLPKQPFLHRLIISNPTEDTQACPKFIIVWGRKIARGDAERVQVEEYLNYDEWKLKVKEDFPYLIPAELNGAIENFKKFPEMAYRF